MSEVYVELDLRLPEESAKEMAGILDEANPGGDDEFMFRHYGRLGDGIEAMLRASAADDPSWLDEQLTPGEALIPQGFASNGTRARVQYMVGDEDTGEALAHFMQDVFSAAGIEVAAIRVIDEHSLEDEEYDDEDEDEEGEFDDLEA